MLPLPVLAMVSLLIPTAGRTEPPGQYIITMTRAKEIKALVLPYKLYQEINGRWKLAGISIGSTKIIYRLQAATEKPAEVILRKRGLTARPFLQTRSFDIKLSLPEGGKGRRAALALSQAIKQNDRKFFWQALAPREYPTISPVELSLLLICLLLPLGLIFLMALRRRRDAIKTSLPPS